MVNKPVIALIYLSSVLLQSLATIFLEMPQAFLAHLAATYHGVLQHDCHVELAHAAGLKAHLHLVEHSFLYDLMQLHRATWQAHTAIPQVVEDKPEVFRVTVQEHPSLHHFAYVKHHGQ